MFAQMFQRSGAIMLKTVRWSGWPLFVVVIGFIVTGYATSGRYGMGKLIDARTAMALHKLLHLPLLVLLLVHALPAMYLAVRRWGLFAKTSRIKCNPKSQN